MNAVPHTDIRKRWKYSLGGLLCCLLLVYAVGAKLALYHLQQPGARSVAATKAWQNNAIPSVEIEIEIVPVHAMPAALNLVATVFSLLITTIWCLALEAPVKTRTRWFSPYLSVRPPPAL